MLASRVAGVDAALGGWIAVILDGEGFERAELVPADFAQVLASLLDVQVIGVDVPIGLPTEGRRRADIEARAFLGVRRSAVFFAPPAGSFDAKTYADARVRHPSMSAQTWALERAIVDVERYAGDPRVHEVHPEVSFRALYASEVPFAKRSWNGSQLRMELLREAGIAIPSDLGVPGRAPVDDIVDAAIVAWTARRMASGLSKTLPADPSSGEPTITY